MTPDQGDLAHIGGYLQAIFRRLLVVEEPAELDPVQLPLWSREEEHA